MVEHTVQDHPHPAALCRRAQRPKILFRAQHGIDLGIISGIVAVVGGGLKNGTEIQRGDTHSGQIVQLRGDPRQGTAKKVAVPDVFVGIRPPFRGILPVLMDPAAADQAVRGGKGGAAESIWENLVSNATAEPRRRMALPVDRQLPGIGQAVTAVAGLVQLAAGAIVPPEAEVIPGQFWLCGSGDGAGKADAAGFPSRWPQLHLLRGAGKFMVQDHGTVGEVLLCQGTAVKSDVLSACDRAKRLFAQFAAGVENKWFAHIMRLLNCGSDESGRTGSRCRLYQKAAGRNHHVQKQPNREGKRAAAEVSGPTVPAGFFASLPAAADAVDHQEDDSDHRQQTGDQPKPNDQRQQHVVQIPVGIGVGRIQRCAVRLVIGVKPLGRPQPSPLSARSRGTSLRRGDQKNRAACS